ncbi:MAG: hypothetical protein R2991_17175 [Thermoanaerobaculia bacterium]
MLASVTAIQLLPSRPPTEPTTALPIGTGTGSARSARHLPGRDLRPHIATAHPLDT